MNYPQEGQGHREAPTRALALHHIKQYCSDQISILLKFNTVIFSFFLLLYLKDLMTYQVLYIQVKPYPGPIISMYVMYVLKQVRGNNTGLDYFAG